MTGRILSVSVNLSMVGGWGGVNRSQRSILSCCGVTSYSFPLSLRVFAGLSSAEDVLSISQRKPRPQSLGSEFLLRAPASSAGQDASVTPSTEDEAETVSGDHTIAKDASHFSTCHVCYLYPALLYWLLII